MGTAANGRLRLVMASGGWTCSALAGAVGVDPKTVERWVNLGRTPRRGVALKAAETLGEDVHELWPALRQSRAARAVSPELVALYEQRADMPVSMFAELVARARQQVDVLVYAAVYLHEAYPRLNEVLCERAAAGCSIRIAVGDPRAPAYRRVARRRGLDSASSRGAASLSCTTARCSQRPASSCAPTERPCTTASIAWTTTCWSTRTCDVNAYRAPVWHLRREGPGGLFDTYADSFARAWDTAQAVERVSPWPGPSTTTIRTRPGPTAWWWRHPPWSLMTKAECCFSGAATATCGRCRAAPWTMGSRCRGRRAEVKERRGSTSRSPACRHLHRSPSHHRLQRRRGTAAVQHLLHGPSRGRCPRRVGQKAPTCASWRSRTLRHSRCTTRGGCAISTTCNGARTRTSADRAARRPATVPPAPAGSRAGDGRFPPLRSGPVSRHGAIIAGAAAAGQGRNVLLRAESATQVLASLRRPGGRSGAVPQVADDGDGQGVVPHPRGRRPPPQTVQDPYGPGRVAQVRVRPGHVQQQPGAPRRGVSRLGACPWPAPGPLLGARAGRPEAHPLDTDGGPAEHRHQAPVGRRRQVRQAARRLLRLDHHHVRRLVVVAPGVRRGGGHEQAAPHPRARSVFPRRTARCPPSCRSLAEGGSLPGRPLFRAPAADSSRASAMTPGRTSMSRPNSAAW